MNRRERVNGLPWAWLVPGVLCLLSTGCANVQAWRSGGFEEVLEGNTLSRPLPAADLRRHPQPKPNESHPTAKRVGTKSTTPASTAPATTTASKANTAKKPTAPPSTASGAVTASLSDDADESPQPTAPLAPAAQTTQRPTKMIPRPSIEEMLENNWPIVASHLAQKLDESYTANESAANAKRVQQLPLPAAEAAVAEMALAQETAAVPARKVPAQSDEKKTPESNATSEQVSHSDRKSEAQAVVPASATSANESAQVKLAVAHLPAISETKPEPPPTYQAGDWLKHRDKAIATLEEEIRLAKKDRARHSEMPQLETLLRLHYALAGRRDDAARTIEGLPAAEQEFWKHQAFGLVDLLAADRLASESRRYAVALQSFEEAQHHLGAAGTLALKNIAFCKKVDDFGRIEKFEKYDFACNQEVLLYVEARNFAAAKLAQGYETELQGSFRVLDRSGIARSERMLPLDRQSCSNHRRDYYIAYRIYIPTELSPGAYTLELTLEDKKGNKSNNAILDFNVAK